MMKVQNERNNEYSPACQAPVARSVYQAVLTIGFPHQLGLLMLELQVFNTLYSQQNQGILPVLSPLKSASGSNSTGSDTAGSRIEAES